MAAHWQVPCLHDAINHRPAFLLCCCTYILSNIFGENLNSFNCFIRLVAPAGATTSIKIIPQFLKRFIIFKNGQKKKETKGSPKAEASGVGRRRLRRRQRRCRLVRRAEHWRRSVQSKHLCLFAGNIFLLHHWNVVIFILLLERELGLLSEPVPLPSTQPPPFTLDPPHVDK